MQKALSVLADDSKVVGAIGALYIDGRKVGQGSAGTRLLGGKGGKIPAGARYRVGSWSKQMTQVVIMQLVGEGKLALDDKLSARLPVVVEKDLVDRADEITVEQLFHHTSGIPNWYEPEVVDFFDFTTYQPPLELVAKTRDLPRTGEPGETYSYSNTNYFLLGLIIEEITGHTLATEFERRVFGPVGMDDSYLPTRMPGNIKGRHGHGYFPDENGELVDFDRLNMSYGYAAGGVISTADDMSAFHRAWAGEKLLSKELKEAMNAGRPPRDPDQPLPEPLCGGEGEYQQGKGTAPGYNAPAFVSRDGRVQFVMSATLSTRNTDPGLDPLFTKAAEAVLCPGT